MRNRIKRKSSVIGALLLLPLLTFCKKEDEYVYPPVITEILSAGTDDNGRLSYLYTDKGKTYRAVNGGKITGLYPDTLFRVISVYEVLEDPSEALVYSFKEIVAPNPVKADRIAGGIKTDPVEIQSIWKSGEYINLSLLIKAQDGRHTFHFIQTALRQQDGRKKLYLTLYHNRGEDVEAYTQKAYLSVPLAGYKDLLESGDSILFSVNTYKGMKVYGFTYI